MPPNIEYNVKLNFSGSIQDFERMAEGLQKIAAIGKVSFEIEKGVAIETVPFPESGIKELTFGSFTRRIPFPGYPPPDWLGKDLINNLVKGAERIKINTDIKGGMRNPHLHVGNEIALLDKAKFKQFVGEVAAKVSKGLLK